MDDLPQQIGDEEDAGSIVNGGDDQTSATRDLERGFTDSELATCMKVLSKLGENPALLKRKEYRDLRRAAGVFIDGMENKFFQGGNSAYDFALEKEKRMESKRKEQRKKALDKEKLNKAGLRAARTAALNKLLETSAPGHLLEDKKEEASQPQPEGHTEQLNNPRSCYICKTRFYDLHFFYDQLCPNCAPISWTRRTRMVDLKGKIALVTGARIKIGLQVGLRLLRCGATVHVTTRFPHDAALRYGKEPDFNDWKDRLFVHGLDLRDLKGVEAFCHHLRATLPYLHMIVNNAAQTVRRNPQYYAHLMPNESLPTDQLPEGVKDVVHANNYVAISSLSGKFQGLLGSGGVGVGDAGVVVDATPEVRTSAALSQVPLTEEDFNVDKKLFPSQKYDEHNQQVDMRDYNSWLMKLHEVPTVEIVEVTAVNAIAPFIINRDLKPLMLKCPPGDFKYIVNVSAMEGKFYRYKTFTHPHTNMAKASLNMMTRTSADDYVQDHIYMNCVDTGWITDENPYDKAQDIAAKGFQTPIDEQEASSRILDPILHGEATGVREWGKFYKDYAHSEW